jgi:hypothetical protein
MSASFRKDPFIGWTRFQHGDFQCTVVTDGPLKIGPPANGFPKADPTSCPIVTTWSSSDPSETARPRECFDRVLCLSVENPNFIL